MTLPSVSVLIPTYARTALLAEAMECFFPMDYKGDIHLVIFNDCIQQKLEFHYDASTWPTNLKSCLIANAAKRYPNLAAKRQDMLDYSRPGSVAPNEVSYIAFLDDDDLMMPWYLDALAAHPTAPVIMAKQQFKTDGDTWWIEDVPGGLFMIIRRDVALSVGFHSGLNIGEDNAFRNAVIEKVGKQNIVWDPKPGYVYRSTVVGGMHISKALNPKAEFDEAMYLKSVAKRMAEGQEPTGTIVLQPMWREDYEEKARNLLRML